MMSIQTVGHQTRGAEESSPSPVKTTTVYTITPNGEPIKNEEVRTDMSPSSYDNKTQLAMKYNKSSISVVLPAVQSDHLDPSPRSNQNVVIAPRDNITRMIEIFNADDPGVAKTKTVSRSGSMM